MKKYLVDVYLPSIDRHYDVRLPGAKKVHEVTKLLADIAERLSDGAYMYTSDVMLMDANTGLPIDRNATVTGAGIRNASHLILI